MAEPERINSIMDKMGIERIAYLYNEHKEVIAEAVYNAGKDLIFPAIGTTKKGSYANYISLDGGKILKSLTGKVFEDLKG